MISTNYLSQTIPLVVVLCTDTRMFLPLSASYLYCVLICLKSFVLIISANFSSTQLILCLSDGASSCRRGINVWSRPLVTTLYPGCTKQQNSLPFYIYCQNMIVFITCIGLCSFLWVIPGDYCQLCVLPVLCTLSSSLPIVCSSYSTE